MAHRLDRGQGLLYGTASDDSHHYHPQKKAASGYVDTGFVVVNCPGEFTYAAIVEAMKRGDFYASCGVYLDAVEFDKATKTLQVKVQAEEGVNYKIEFITTKRDFDHTIKTTKYMFDKGFARDLTTVGEDIGNRTFPDKSAGIILCSAGKTESPVQKCQMETAPSLKCVGRCCDSALERGDIQEIP